MRTVLKAECGFFMLIVKSTDNAGVIKKAFALSIKNLYKQKKLPALHKGGGTAHCAVTGDTVEVKSE